MKSKLNSTTEMFPRTTSKAYEHKPYLTVEGPFTSPISDFAILAAWIFMLLVAVLIWGVVYG